MMLAGVAWAGDVETFAGAGAGAATADGNAGSVVDGGGGGVATLTFPSLNPASCSVRLALPNGCPIKLGMVNTSASAEAVTSTLILGAATWLAFAAGLCAST